MGVGERVRRALVRLRRARRRTWSGGERAWIEVRPVAEPARPELAARLRCALEVLPGVRWARYNAGLGRVVVERGGGAPDLAALVGVVEEVEAGLDGVASSFAADPRGLPCDRATDRRLVVELGADAAALLAAALGRGPAEGDEAAALDLAALLRTVEEVPWIRRVVDDWLGAASADLTLGLLDAVASASLRGVTGPAVDAAYRLLRLRSRAAVRRLWVAREAELGGRPAAHEGGVVARTRAAPLPEGPIEAYAGGAVLAALGGFGVGVAHTRRIERASAAVFGGVPKPAHAGRKAFAAALAETLSARRFLVLDTRALRRLDRLDTLVVEGSLLAPTAGELVGVHAVRGADGAARARVVAMFDPGEPFAMQREADRVLGPLSRLELGIDDGLAARLRLAAAPGGRLLGLVEGGALVAVAAVRPELAPGADALVAAARSAGLRLVVAEDEPARVGWLGPERIVPAGRGLAAALVRLQEERRGLLGVAGAGSPVLEACDLGVGLPGDGVTPWEAHVIAPAGLGDAATIIEAVVAAKRCARQSVQVATIEAVAGLAMALQVSDARTTARVMAVSNLATLLAMVNGARIGGALSDAPSPRRRDHTPWHALDVGPVLARLGSRERGLSAAEAAARRVAPPPPPARLDQLARVFGEELDNPLAPVLAAGAALSALTGSTTDALMVGGVLAVNGMVGAAQRVRAEVALAELDRQEARRVRALRDGVWRDVPAEAVVPGDVVRLTAGEVVPGDARVMSAVGLEADESALTGESVPVPKSAAASFAPALGDRSSMLFAGTTVAAGDATAVVVAVGDDVEAKAARPAPRVPGGVEARLDALTGFTAPIAAVAGLAVLLSGLARRGKPGELVGSAVSLSVAAVPEGLPLLATLAQLATARRLARRGALVRTPRAIEALGRVDVLCADKTGTLTEGRLRVQRVVGGDEVLRLALRASPAMDGAPLAHPTDQAIVDAAVAAGLAEAWTRVSELPFEPGRGLHATLGGPPGQRTLAVKGAPEVVLARCRWRIVDGRRRPLSAAGRRALRDEATALAGEGLRVLAVAEGQGDTFDDGALDALVWRGMVGIEDPARASGRRAVEALGRAGVRVMMITGDHPGTAAHIGGQLGLRTGRVVAGPELDAMSAEGLAEALGEVDVWARVTPAQKVRLVTALQAAGRVVAMTGDGANDAPAIRQADVGIALGERATTAARHAAALVVADGRVETLVDALLEGRALWAAVRDAVGMLVGSNLGEIGYMLLGGVVSGRAPLNARQLLLVNLLTDALPALALAVRTPDASDPARLAEAGPEASLGAALERDIAWRAAVTAGAAGVGWTLGRWTLPPKQADTVGLVSLVGSQLGQTLLLSRGSPEVQLAGVGSLAALLAVVQVPPLARFFGCAPLGPVGLAQAAAAALGGTAAAAALPPVAERLGDRLGRAWEGRGPVVREAARLVTESRTLRRLVERGRRLRDRVGGVEAGEGT